MNQNKIVKFSCSKDANINLKVIEGHFATPYSHISHYLDMTSMKTRQNEAERIAVVMKDYYNSMDKPIDTIICMDGTEVIGAFLASELSKAGVLSTNAHKTIYVLSPEFDSRGLMFFRDNVKHEIKNKNVLILLPTATTGATIKNCLECVSYYGGTVQGISAIFSAVSEINGQHVDALFTPNDITMYRSYNAAVCPMCQSGQKLEAIVNGYGYSLL